MEMADQEHDEAAERFKNAAQQIADYDYGEADLARAEAWGRELSMPEVNALVFRMALIAEKLRKTPTAAVSLKQLHDATNQLTSLKGVYDKLREKSQQSLYEEAGSPDKVQGARLNQIQGLRNSHHKLCVIAANMLPLGTGDDEKSIEVRVQAAEEQLAAAQKEAEAQLAEIALVKEEAKQALAAIQAATGEAGVEKQSEHFGKLRDRHNTGARIWLALTVACAIGWAVLAYRWSMTAVAGRLSSDVSPGGAILFVSFRIAVLSVALYAVLWCARNFQRHKHNELVNDHRATSLKTFRAFMESSDDEATRNAVLLKATASIFASQPTGFSNTERGDAPTSILEIVRTLSSDKGNDSKG